MTPPHATMLELATAVMPAKPVVLEAGSHDGTDTSLLSATWPDARIYAIEPTPHTHAALVARDLPNVTCRSFAFSAGNGTADFHVEYSGDGGASSLLEGEPWFLRDYAGREQVIEVTTKTLDSWCCEEGLDRIDFMWLDLEGMELPVLQHGRAILETTSAIFTEVNFVSPRKGYTMYPDLHAFLTGEGYAEVWRESQGGAPWGEWTGNVLYTRRAREPRR